LQKVHEIEGLTF